MAEMVIVKEWFLVQKKDEVLRTWQTFIPGEAAKVIRETEKAYLVEMAYCTLDGEDDGVKQFWCPKKCTMTVEEYQKETADRFDEYDRILAFAKEHGVKGVRKGMKKVTLMKKIREAGLDIA